MVTVSPRVHVLRSVHKCSDLAAEGLRGSALPLAEAGSALVVAPREEMPWWREVIEPYGRAERRDTHQYIPRRLGLAETAGLIDEVTKGADPRSRRMVEDELTDMLIVTTTPSRHREVRDLLDGLKSADAGPRRPRRAFPNRNRQVAEIRVRTEGWPSGRSHRRREPGSPLFRPPPSSS